jgi:hypothetical protein
MVVLGLIRLWAAHFSLREEIARSYVKKDDLTSSIAAVGQRMERVEGDVTELRKTTSRILELVAEIRGMTNVHGAIGGS